MMMSFRGCCERVNSENLTVAAPSSGTMNRATALHHYRGLNCVSCQYSQLPLSAGVDERSW